MRKVIAAFNMTLDGVCDHTAGVPDEGLHQHYSDLINNADVILYGRKTYELMQFWQPLLKNPSGQQSMNEFAVAINTIQKIVFSNTLPDTGWDTATLAKQSLELEVSQLRQQPGKNILIGSRSLIIQLLNSNLVDEFQLCIHPVIEGSGLKLLDEIKSQIMLKLHNTKILNSGAIILYYEPVRK